jgi:hypothetical protein
MLVFDPRKRITATECLAEEYVSPYHDASDEPDAREKFDWSFNDADLPVDTWKVMMYSEILGMRFLSQSPWSLTQDLCRFPSSRGGRFGALHCSDYQHAQWRDTQGRSHCPSGYWCAVGRGTCLRVRREWRNEAIYGLILYTTDLSDHRLLVNSSLSQSVFLGLIFSIRTLACTRILYALT